MKAKLAFNFQIMLALVLLWAITSCNPVDSSKEAPFPKPIAFDLDKIKERGKLILLTENSASTYFLYRNQARGFDYELVKAFAKHLGVKLEVQLLDDVDRMFEMLNRGEGDIIASNLTVTPEREKIVRFSSPVYTTRQILVQHLADSTAKTPFVKDSSQLHLIPIWVHHYSSFFTRLKAMEKTQGISFQIHEAPGEMNTDDLLRLVAQGEIPATITDENLAIIQQKDYPELDMSVPITRPQNIAWAVRSNSNQLIEILNAWLEKSTTRRKLTATYQNYFGSEQLLDYKGPYAMPELSANQISAYDSLFKKYAPEIAWDWRLLAALVYQESRFNPLAKSWSGAFGLMQLMPETAAKFGCDSSQTEEPNIRAGVKYIRYLDRFWKDRINNETERIKFVLASYNIGPGHVLDAIQIARHTGKSDTLWDGHVAECLLLKTQEKFYTLPGVKHGYCHAREPFHFVAKITSVFDHYKSAIQP
jgi:membrane-bound lytic murein transglycosylase F